MALIERIQVDQQAARALAGDLREKMKSGEVPEQLNKHALKASLLTTLISETTTVPSSVFATGAGKLRKQAQAENWAPDRLDTEQDAARAASKTKKRLFAEALSDRAITEGLNEQQVLDALTDGEKDIDKELAVTLLALEFDAVEQQWPVGRLKQALYDLGAEIQCFVPSDAEVWKTVTSFIANATVTRDALLKRGDFEAVAQAGFLQDEIDTLSAYLPQKKTAEELAQIIADFKAANPGAHKGLIMTHLKDNYAGLYDGKAAAQLAG